MPLISISKIEFCLIILIINTEERIIAVLCCMLLLVATVAACEDKGDTGENPGGDVIETPGGENPGGENPGGETPGGDVTENPEPEVYYTVTFDTQGGSEMASVKIESGHIVGDISITLPTKQCGRLVGFALDTNGEVLWNIASDKVNGNITLYAIWEDAHTWGEWETVTEPTCTAEGTRKRICEVCEKEETESIPATEHTWGAWETVTEPTCTTEGMHKHVCEVCGKEETESIPVTEHTWGEWETVIEPTCTAEGTHKRICEVCGEEELDSIPSLGHDFEEEYTVDVAPDCVTKGSESRHCTTLHEVRRHDRQPRGRGDRTYLGRMENRNRAYVYRRGYA